MRFFNTSGPVVAVKHYCIPPLERLDLGGMLQLIDQERYFVLHAPRQTGKTSVLLALRDELNRNGQYRCVYINVEVGQAARENVGAAKVNVSEVTGSPVSGTRMSTRCQARPASFLAEPSLSSSWSRRLD